MSDENPIMWARDLYGMSQRQDSDETPIESCALLKNVSLSKPGSWTKRKGTDLLSTTQAGGGVQGLIDYSQVDGTYGLRAIRSTDLDTYSLVNDTYTAIDTAQFAGNDIQEQETQDGDLGDTTDRYFAQSFTTASAGVLTEIQLYLKRVIGTHTLVVYIHSDNSDKPGSVLSTVGAIPTDTSYVWVSISTSVVVTTATKYWIVIKGLKPSVVLGGGTHQIHWGYNTAGGYANGKTLWSDDNGGTWSDTGFSGDDATFRAIISGTQNSGVQSENYKNRVYHISSVDFLNYESGSTCTDVGTGNDRLKGSTVKTAQNTLFVGGLNYGVGAAQDWRDRVYYSLYDVTSNIPDDQFWNDGEGDLTSSTRFFTVGAPVRALYAYNNMIHVFTHRNCWTFDMRYEQQAIGPQTVFYRGCAGPRAITECAGWLIFMDDDARIWAWGGAGLPRELSWDIEDDELQEAVINSIDQSNLAQVAAGSLGNQFWFSVGDISYIGEAVSNACVRGLITQNLGSVLWSIDSYPVKPTIFTNVTFDNDRQIVFGSSSSDDVYLMNTGTNDAGSAIDSFGRTRFYDFGKPINSKEGDRLYIKYRPQGDADTYLTVKYATDGNFSYTTISDPDATTPVVNYGKIDMYEDDYNTNKDAVMFVKIPPTNFRTISVEVGNAQTGESYQVKAIGFQFREISLDTVPERSV